MSDVFRENLLKDKVAFFAGASSGINLGVAQRFAREGAKVVLISRSHDKIQDAVKSITDEGGTAFGMACDVRDFESVDGALKKAKEEYGEIDFVLSGAAGNFVAPALGMSSNGFKVVIDIDLIGTFNVLRASFPYLKRPGASLVAITAPQAVQPAMFQAHVCAAKAGINMLVKCLGLEWGPGGVRVNAVSPGPIADTEGMRRLAPTPEAEEAIISSIALREYGTKTDIAETCMWLSSDASRYVTGTIIDCDGGTTLGSAKGDAIGELGDQIPDFTAR
ncbi:MAG: SDR family oxidoreductase [Alphaproteobacteria bacterium]|nr:SDR family oxidoreductase [Alphaproteobacteria bacterium]